MSCTLYWKPVGGGRPVGDAQLRDLLRDEYGEYPCRLTAEALPFLRGLRAAKVDGAADLLNALEKHDTIDLFVEC